MNDLMSRTEGSFAHMKLAYHDGMAFHPDEMPFHQDDMQFHHEDMPFDHDEMPFDHDEMPFYHEGMPFHHEDTPFHHGDLPFHHDNMSFSNCRAARVHSVTFALIRNFFLFTLMEFYKRACACLCVSAPARLADE